MAPLDFIAAFIRLQQPKLRVAAAQELAQRLGIGELLLFGKDAGIGVFLPAPGFLQTLQQGRAWQVLLNTCAEAGECRTAHPNRSELEIFAICDQERECIMVFVDGLPDAESLAWLRTMLPLLGAKLVDERSSLIAKGNAIAARAASKKADELNYALDQNRIELEKAIQRAEKELISRREAEDQLREAGRRKDEFLAMLAHELRNPLAPISAAAELLKLSHSDERRILKVSAVIARQVHHMTGLIDDLLDVSRVTRGIITLDKEILKLQDLIADAVEQVNSLIGERHHVLHVHAGDEPVYVYGDRTRLVQVFSNLLNNAAKYTPPGGRLEIMVDYGPQSTDLHVRDNGIGISAELLPYVFDLFTQAERSQDRSQGGLGLGLALAKSLVDLHGGSISACSEGSGKGCEFTVRLPRQLVGPHSGERPATLSVPESPVKLSILVVDDNVDAAQMLAMFLEAAGHETLVAHGSQDALGHARTFAPDVCMVDIGLPDMDGNELASRLRDMKETAHATLIAITGYGQTHDRESAVSSGFSSYFVKPVDMAELVKLLAGLRPGGEKQ